MAKDNETEATDSAPVNDGPLMIEGPKAAAEADTPIIDLEAIKSHNDESAAAEHIEPEHTSRWRSYAPLAAAIVCAATVGVVAGAVATSLMRGQSSAPVTADVTGAIQNSVAQLNNELAALKTGIANAQRNSTSQFGKITDRLERSEKAQAEPTAKLAKIQETLERLDRRPPQAAANAPASDITGSISPPKTVAAKEEPKLQLAEGWMLRDFYDGRAIVESRNGTLFRIAPGSNVPGLGKVESIKRENGKIVVLTAKGIISASIEQQPSRRPGYYDRW